MSLTQIIPSPGAPLIWSIPSPGASPHLEYLHPSTGAPLVLMPRHGGVSPVQAAGAFQLWSIRG